MATYSNKHWLLSHIRNSFISTDDTGMCETVMLSDDMPKHYLRKFQSAKSGVQDQRKPQTSSSTGTTAKNKHLETPMQEVDFVYYPGLDLSDDEDIDISALSFDIQMYPEGAHRFRSNTAQKLEKLDIAKRKAARIKSVNYNDEVQPPDRPDFFVRKTVVERTSDTTSKYTANDDDDQDVSIKSKLALQLANYPKQLQNKFSDYARFDGTSQVGMLTKRINVYLNMLPERERNYPLKICVIANARIFEVIGLVCYKATIQYPDLPLKSIKDYALYMTEDNDDMEDFPPLDNREPCSKFGFSHLTLAERRPLVPVTRITYHNNLATKSMTSEEAASAEAAVRAMQGIELNGGTSETGNSNDNLKEYEERLLNHNDMLEAPNYRTYKVNIIDKRFFKYEGTLGISGESIEIHQHKNPKFWSNRKSTTTPIDLIAFCEIVERRLLKATLRIWLKSNSSSGTGSSSCTSAQLSSSSDESRSATQGASGGSLSIAANSPSSPSHYPQHSSPFSFFGGSGGQHMQAHIRFKHYDFETDTQTAEQIRLKLNCILEVRSSETRREFLHQRERKQEKQLAKKQLKL